MKIKETIMITIGALAFLLITGIAKADDTIDVKIKNHIANEISKTKEYQTKVWAEAKTKWPWNKIFKGKDNE